MTPSETRQRIAADDAFILSETERLRYVYTLKKEIRYAQERKETLDTESVAEHVFGMQVLANYFLPLEDTAGEWNKLKILETITWHDIDEIETGDTLAHLKTAAHRKEAEQALPKVISRLPETIRQHIDDLMQEYEERKTPEARFVKAIDVIEPLFEVRGEGYKAILQKNGNTLADHWRTKRPHLEYFPYMLRFADVLTSRLEQEGFFVT